MVPPEGRTRSTTRGRKKPPQAGSPVPERDCHLERIQRAFGPRYDLSSVRVHLDERSAAASRSIRAAAYTIGDAVAFDGWPDFHTAVTRLHMSCSSGGVFRFRAV